MQSLTPTKKTYLICLLDGEKDNQQRGIWTVETESSSEQIIRIITCIRRTLGTRWCVDIQLVKDEECKLLLSLPGAVAVGKQIADKIREHEGKAASILEIIPSNITNGGTATDDFCGMPHELNEYLLPSIKPTELGRTFDRQEEHRRRLEGR